MTKTCSKCEIEKLATTEFFNVHRECKGGLNSSCRECKNSHGRDRYKDPTVRARIKESHAKWYDSHIDEVKSRQRRYATERRADPVFRETARRNSAARRADPQKRAQDNAVFRAKVESDPEYRLKRNQSSLRWGRENQDRKRRYAAAWSRANRAMDNAKKARRMAAKLRATPGWVDVAALKRVCIFVARRECRLIILCPCEAALLAACTCLGICNIFQVRKTPARVIDLRLNDVKRDNDGHEVLSRLYQS